MNGYYARPFPADTAEPMMGIVNQDGMDQSALMGHSLDDIVNENAQSMRRRSMPMHYGGNPGAVNNAIGNDMRRLSVMSFGNPTGNPMDSFTFSMDGFPATADPYGDPSSDPNIMQGRQVPGDFALNPAFANTSPSTYATMPPPSAAYASPLDGAMSIDMGMATPYGAPLGLDMNGPSIDAVMGHDLTPLDIFPGSDLATPMLGSPVAPEYQVQDVDNNMQLTDQFMGSVTPSMPPPLHTPEHHSTTPEGVLSRSSSQSQIMNGSSKSTNRLLERTPSSQAPSIPTPSQPYGPERPQMTSPDSQQGQYPWVTPAGGFPSTLPNGKPHMNSTQFKNIYSSSGFDMLGVLTRVATRPNPEINIGRVDLSCAFVVCDVEQDDVPIVYCSEAFERLTGYTKHMIMGRNCRFLQAPDGHVQPGMKRKYVDDESVFHLKNMINMRKEVQVSLINYRRGGQPFMNLLTMIPICWDTESVKFFVGFQVDLVEQPGAIQERNTDGTYNINYQRGVSLPGYVINIHERPAPIDHGQTVSRDDVSNVLAAYAHSGDSDFTKRVWDKVLLENTDDVVHVLSLKGLFMYVSPSCRKILEYESSELVGSALSSICHPSDIVPVTRELKDASSGPSVNIVFRIKRKHSGYMWFEGHGSLHTEQGKGRKCIILVGRERPVYAISRDDIVSAGGIGENELWTKMSTSGMFLFVSSNVRQLLDRQPDELVGTSIQALMRQESKVEFGRILGIVRTGKKASVKHEMINKRGQVLQAYSTLYPGDATEGHKPTFVVAQTKLLKFTRASIAAGQRPPLIPKLESQTSAGSMPSTTSRTTSSNTRGDGTPMSSVSGNAYESTAGQAVTHAGVDGLPIGHQDATLASEENVFDELKTTRSSSWQYELRQMEKRNRILAEEVQSLLAAKKKRKRRKGNGQMQKDCANCHTKVTPEWRRGPSGNRDLCNSCGLRWAKQNGRVSPRASSQHSVSAQSDRASKSSVSPRHIQSIKGHVTNNGTESSTSTITPGDKQTSPRHGGAETHSSKLARLPGPHSIPGNIPPSIAEGVEPPN